MGENGITTSARVLLAAMVLLAGPASWCRPVAEQTIGPQCGLMCLAFIYRCLGVDHDRQTLVKQAGYSAASGTTFLGLELSARSKGFHVAALSGLLGEITPLLHSQTYGILARKNHFVVLSRKPHGVFVVDPMLKSIARLPAHMLDEVYPVLLIGTEKIGLPHSAKGRWLRVLPLALINGVIVLAIAVHFLRRRCCRTT